MNASARLLAVTLVVLGSCSAASAQLAVDLRVKVAPPMVRVEAPPPPPAPDAYWISGHWKWEAAQYVWVAGHWAAPRVGEVYVRARWVREGGEWVFRPGHWAKIVPPREFVSVVVRQAPPALRVEVMPPPPSAEHFWIAGHWRWENNRFAWVAGRWELHRPDFVWVPEHWLHAGAEWHFAGGHWQRV